MEFEDLAVGTILRWEGAWAEEYTKQDDGTWVLSEHNSGLAFLETGMEILPNVLKDYWANDQLTVKE